MAELLALTRAVAGEHDPHAQDGMPEEGAAGDLLAIEAMDWLACREGRRGVLAMIRSASDTGPVMEEAVVPEHVRVHEWRRDCLRDLEPSLEIDRADVLALEVDPHEVARLVRAGCPFELAVEIVR